MKNIYLFCILLVLSLSAQAQVDRSKRPAAGPAPKINFDTPKSFKLKNGITVMLVEDHKLPSVSVSLSMTRVPQVDGEKAGVSDLLDAMLSEGTQKRSKADFDELVDLMGASVSLNAFGGSASSLKADFDKTISLMAEAMMHPAFTAESFEKVKSQTITGLKADERNTNSIASRMTNFINFGPNHPYGEFVTIAKMEKLTLDDVKNAYKQIYMPNNSYLVFAGDITEAEVKSLANKYFAAWPMGKLIEKPVPASTPKKATEIYLVDVPTASQSVLSITNVVHNTRKSPDAFALSVAGNVLGGGAEGYLFMNLREKNSYTYGAYASVGSDKYGAAFRASASVGDTVVEKAIKEVIFEMNRLINEPADATAITLVKSKAAGSFALSMENKSTIAGYAINIERDGLPKNYYSTYLQNLNKINATDIQRVAKQYMNPNAISIVVAGRALEIGPRLETLGYKINYLDAYGNTIAKPEAQKADISAKELIDKYFTALGGVNVLKAKTSYHLVMEGNIQGATLSASESRKANKLEQEIKVMGNTMMKTVIDGTKATLVAQGAEQPFPEELRKAQSSDYAVAELMLLDPAANNTVKGLEEGNYLLETTNTWGKVVRYIDAKTYLLTKSVTSINIPNAPSNEVVFSNYKPVNGVQIAHTQEVGLGGMKVELAVKEAVIN